MDGHLSCERIAQGRSATYVNMIFHNKGMGHTLVLYYCVAECHRRFRACCGYAERGSVPRTVR